MLMTSFTRLGTDRGDNMSPQDGGVGVRISILSTRNCCDLQYTSKVFECMCERDLSKIKTQQMIHTINSMAVTRIRMLFQYFAFKTADC